VKRMARVRHSTAFSALGDEQFSAYRALCLDRGKTLADLAAWAKETAGLKLSASMVKRDRDWFLAEAERVERFRLRAQLAGQLAAQLGSDEQVAAMQSRAVDLFTQVAFDALGSVGDVDLDSMPKLAAMGAALASVQRSALSAYRAEIDRRTRAAAEQVKQIGSRRRLDQATIDEIRESVFGITG
jgi:hypothetical protein